MKLTKRTQSDQHSSFYERRGNRATQRIAAAIAQKSWKWTFLDLAWTMGPVTFLALQAGHFLGFGDIAPLKNFIYFAAYTLVAGVFAVIAGIIRDAFYKPRIDNNQQMLQDAVDRLHVTMLRARNHVLLGYDEHERKILSAYYVLQSAGTTPSSLEAAIMDLTDNETITQAARHAYVFAEQGMYSRVDMIWEEIQPELVSLKPSLQTQAAQAYALLEERLQGYTADMRKGVERTEGFIERVLRAAEDNSIETLSYTDIYELFTLAFELINGRKIAVLDARFKGDGAFEEAQEDLDEAWHHYRLALRRRNSRIRMLAETLYEQDAGTLVPDATDAVKPLLNAVKTGIQSLPAKEKRALREDYERIVRLNKQLAIQREKLLKAESVYSRKWRQHGEKLTLAMQSGDLKKAGFYIDERTISLTNKQKITLGEWVIHEIPEEYEALSEKKLKTLAIDLAHMLDDYLDMSQPEEQLAIESSNAANFGFITTALTGVTKAGWASLAVDATHENRRKASHRLARQLVTFYRVPLTQSMIDLFVFVFGAEEDYLVSLKDVAAQSSDQKSPGLPSPPLSMPSWEQLITS